jgi:hypothetical protein
MLFLSLIFFFIVGASSSFPCSSSSPVIAVNFGLDKLHTLGWGQEGIVRLSWEFRTEPKNFLLLLIISR